MSLFNQKVFDLKMLPKIAIILFANIFFLVVVNSRSVSYAAIFAEERTALIDLFNSTDGNNWNKKGGWLGPVGSECGWYGITCDLFQNHVIQIKLPDNNLIGTLPDSIGNFSKLRTLDLNYNELEGDIPAQLGDLSELIDLNLSDNFLSGSLPSGIGDLSQLEDLDLTANELAGNIPPQIANLSNLIRLYLYDNFFTGNLPNGLAGLTKLKVLDLGSNYFGGPIPAQLQQLSKLQELRLGYNELEGAIPPGLGNLNKLQLLTLHQNRLSESIPAQLGDLANLKVLSLSGNQIVGEIPTALMDLSNLEDAYLLYNGLFTEDIALLDFLSTVTPDWTLDWEKTQTIPPENLALSSAGTTAMQLSWTPIAYTAYHGGYRVYYSNTADGPFTFYEETLDKTTSSMYVDSLPAGFTYYFYIQTITYRHPLNQNDVISEESAMVSINLCEGNFVNDNEVNQDDLLVFTDDFGRDDCCWPSALPCEGNFDKDCDVDAADLLVFEADFGRTNCP
jgi:hypothetical protein